MAIANRYLIGGAVAGAALLAALGFIAFKAASTVPAVTQDGKPAPVAAALTLPAEPAPEPAVEKGEPPPTVPATDLTDAFGAALGVEVKDSPKPRASSANATSKSSPASPPSPDTLDLGAKKDREARFGSHETGPSEIRLTTDRLRETKAGTDDKLTFETQLK